MGDEPDGFGLGQPCFPTGIAGYFLNGPFARRKPHLAKSSQTTLLRNDLQRIEAIVMFKAVTSSDGCVGESVVR
jgi:hypothetical protein